MTSIEMEKGTIERLTKNPRLLSIRSRSLCSVGAGDTNTVDRIIETIEWNIGEVICMASSLMTSVTFQ